MGRPPVGEVRTSASCARGRDSRDPVFSPRPRPRRARRRSRQGHGDDQPRSPRSPAVCAYVTTHAWRGHRETTSPCMTPARALAGAGGVETSEE